MMKPSLIDSAATRLGEFLSAFVSAMLLAVLMQNIGLCDGPADNDPQTVRLVPPAGMDLPGNVKSELLAAADAIDLAADVIEDVDPIALDWVRVIPRAVRISIATDMFYSAKDIEAARRLLAEGKRRVAALKAGEGLHAVASPVQDKSGSQLAVGGFRSKIDQSIQPFGIVLPKETRLGNLQNVQPLRLDVWLHGRGERVSECAFLSQRLSQVGEYAPEGTVVLHPYGRYSNAFKFAGEVDVLEAIEHIRKVLPIDKDRITIRGFSMGGAGCWQMAVHYPDLWAAANPGAGFSETRQFLDVFQGEKYQPVGYARDLLHWYDCPDWVNNLRNVPTVAYSGEIDRQKQAADVMAAAYQAQAMTLPHVIGLQTAHKIHADSKVEISKFLEQALAESGEPSHDQIDFTTYTLRYNALGWLRVTGLQQHWKQARVQGRYDELDQVGVYRLSTEHVSRLEIVIPAKSNRSEVSVVVDGDTFNHTLSTEESATGTKICYRQTSGKWTLQDATNSTAADIELGKRPGLQGPIDDAFMDAFVFVQPDPIEVPSVVDQWAASELEHATGEWLRQMRGDVNLLSVSEVDESVIAANNLVLFGTPESNPLIRRVIDAMPAQWGKSEITLGTHSADAASSALVAIYPNPLNQNKYVVLNSGFTYREYAYLNNARQIPMLPDWALIDIRDGATTQLPGRIIAAGFFDEAWQVK